MKGDCRVSVFLLFVGADQLIFMLSLGRFVCLRIGAAHADAFEKKRSTDYSKVDLQVR